MTAVGCSTFCSEAIDLSRENIDVSSWDEEDVLKWAKEERLTCRVSTCLQSECIDGCVLLELTEDDIRDFRYRLCHDLTFSDMKKLWLSVRALQKRCSLAVGAASAAAAATLNVVECGVGTVPTPPTFEAKATADASPMHRRNCPLSSPVPMMSACGCPMALNANNGGYVGMCSMVANGSGVECENMSPPLSVDGKATHIPPEFFKTAISLGYSFLVTWITSFVMVIVHERVPDMKRYPPLPDIFLDNVPHIPWAFHMCEITGTLLFSIWCCVCVFHKYRMVLLRRFFALAGTVFLLRCVTMLITSLSVPGTHLQCNHNDYAVDDIELSVAEAIELRISRAYTIWSGLGMSIQGVRTCGDYMFSGHTVALTLLNFFITEYTPRNLYFLHTATWILNMFGIFFILAAHEHYSIDVFVAFYITSRLFLYYHTLANNQALMSHDSNRTRIWFPMFSYFESCVDGIIPNEYDSFGTLLENLIHFILSIKDSCMLTARRYWIDPPHLQMISKTILCAPLGTTMPTAVPATTNAKHSSSIASSTDASAYNTPTPLSSTMACSVDESEDSRQNLLRRKLGVTALNELCK